MGDIGDDPFAVSAIWRSEPSMLQAPEEEAFGIFTTLQLDISAIQLDDLGPPGDPWVPKFDLPDPDGHLELDFPEHPISDGSVLSAEHLTLASLEADDFDVWDAVLNDEPSDRGRAIFSWENFTEGEHDESLSCYLSESGGQVFDAALQMYEEHQPSIYRNGNAVQAEPLFKSILALGLGRCSTFFAYDESTRAFCPVLENLRISGLSLDSSQSLIRTVMRCGALLQELRLFAERTYRSSSTLPALVALATVIDSVLSAFEVYVNESSARARSFLQLEDSFRKPAEVLNCLQALVRTVETAKSNTDVASKVFSALEAFDHASASLRRVFPIILNRISQPWLDRVNAQVGLGPRAGSFDATLHGEVSASEADEEFNSTRDTAATDLPKFVNQQTVDVFHEVGTGLSLLRQHQAAHPLCHPNQNPSVTAQLELNFDWADVDRIAAKAVVYETERSKAIAAFEQQDSRLIARTSPLAESRSVAKSRLRPGHTWMSFTEEIEGQIPPIGSVLFTATAVDELSVATEAFFTGQEGQDSHDFGIDAAAIFSAPLLPLLMSQVRLVNAAILRLLFESHQLRAHLELQHQFHLLGNGAFVAQLTPALFDPSRATAERHRGVLRTRESMGLRLGTRSTWPPASSELQLALMGILSHCYESSSLAKKLSRSRESVVGPRDRVELPGNLSFSVRQLPPAEAERCMDPNSLFALDFLRLQYQSSSPIDAVITRVSLEKYDSIFKALLRLLRLLFVASHLPDERLPRHLLRLRHQMSHFVTTCCSYFFDTVSEAWRDFSGLLDECALQQQRRQQDLNVNNATTGGLEGVRRAHELYLDRLLFALFLRKRQAHIMTLLEDTFGLILEFAHVTSTENSFDRSTVPSDHEPLRGMGDSFTGKVQSFIVACQDSCVAKSTGVPSAVEYARGVENLAVGLNWNGFYEGGL